MFAKLLSVAFFLSVCNSVYLFLEYKQALRMVADANKLVKGTTEVLDQCANHLENHPKTPAPMPQKPTAVKKYKAT